MFTKNWYILKAASNGCNGTTGCITQMTTTTINGKESAITHLIDNYARQLYTLPTTVNVNVATSHANHTIIFGDGLVEPSFNDCELAGNVISDIELLKCIGSVEETDDGIIQTCTYYIANTSDSEIVINEYGIVKKAYSTSYSEFLVERSLLETPLVISAGMTAEFKYTLFIPFVV